MRTLGNQNSGAVGGAQLAVLLSFGLILAALCPAGTVRAESGQRSHYGPQTVAFAQPVPTPKAQAPTVTKPSVDPPTVTSRQWVWLQIGLGAAIVVVLWFGSVIKPASLGKGTESGADRPWWAFLFAAVVIYLAMGLGAEVMSAQVRANASWLGGVSADTTKGNALVMLGQCVSGLLAGFAMLALASGGLKRPTGKDLLIGVLAIVIAFPVVNATGLIALEIYKAFKNTSPPTIGHNTLQTISNGKSDPWAWVQAGCAILLTPIVEELIYRYFLQTAIVRVAGRVWLGLVITAALFASAHIGAVPTETLSTVLPVLFVLGLALGIAMQRTGKLCVPIIMHAVFNAINVALTVWR